MSESIESLMAKMPEQWRKHWCFAAEFGGCGCSGCANHSGKLASNGYTYEDWRKFNPDAPPYEVVHAEAKAWYERITSSGG